MNELKLFQNEEFGNVRMVMVDNKPYAVANDVAKALGYVDCPKAIRVHCKGVDEVSIPTNGGIQNVKIIPQGDIIRLSVKCRLEGAEKFESWIFDDVIPEIMNTGSYMQDNEKASAIAAGKIMENASVDLLSMITTMANEQIKIKEQLSITQKENEQLKIDVTHKEDVIVGLVDDIDLSTKRQRLNQIMRYKFTNGKRQSDKWSVLYGEFERKYHINLNARIKRDNEHTKPKFKNKLDYIDRKMNKLPELYELACKIFHNDVEKLKDEWFDVISN